MRKTRKKASYGTIEDRRYAFCVDGVDGASFFGQPFGRRIDAMKKLMSFAETAKSGHADATMKAVREWVKLHEPSQFYAVWRADSPWYKDDSVEIFYT